MALKISEHKICQVFCLAWEEDCILLRLLCGHSELSLLEFSSNVHFYTRVFTAGCQYLLLTLKEAETSLLSVRSAMHLKLVCTVLCSLLSLETVV